jgi:hypothetical protein
MFFLTSRSLSQFGQNAAASRPLRGTCFRLDCRCRFCGYVKGLEGLVRGLLYLVRIITVFSLQPVQLFIPITLPVILLGLLKEKNSTVTASAVTWYVEAAFRKYGD